MKLLEGSGAPIISVVAPAGYGKTVLLSQWAERDDREIVWLTLDERDDDPVLMIGQIVAALDAEESIGDDVLAPLSGPSPDPSRVVVPRLCDAIARRTIPLLLVLDDAHFVSDRATLDCISALAERFPVDSQLVIAARTEPEIGIGRLRARGRIDEVRADSMVMTRSEAAALFEASGLELPEAVVLHLLGRTEGWPAALYLAARAIRDGQDPESFVEQFAGDERLMADYLRETFLSSLAADDLRFLIQASLLNPLSGDLCDAVLDRDGSAEQLRRLSKSNLLLSPLDTKDAEFRMHALLREMLQAELHRVEPREEKELHTRASGWYLDHAEPDRAVEHAIASQDLGAAAQRIWELAPSYNIAGRRATLHGWLDSFGDEQIAASPALSLSAAVTALTDGDGARMMHWQAITDEHLARSDGPVDPDLAVGSEVIRLSGDTPEDLRAVGAGFGSIHDQLPQRSVWRPYSRMLEGLIAMILADLGKARRLLSEGTRPGLLVAPASQSICQAGLALIALDEGRPGDAEHAVTEALARIDFYDLVDYPGSVLPYATAALVRAGRGDRSAAGALAAAHSLFDGLVRVNEWYAALTGTTMARAHLALGDAVAARALLQDVNALRESHPDAVMLEGWLDAARAALDARAGPDERWPLTPAERRVLVLLPTHLSFPEIADELIVSTNTVKTQSRSIYRKLGVSSRSEAVDCARLAGLLGRGMPDSP